jgi:uncharacterized protein YneF (UPF0154 family)
MKLFFLPTLAKFFRSSFLITTAFICVGIFIIFSFFSPYFHLKKISVIRDNPNINAKQIEMSLKDFYGKNLLFLSHQDITITLQESFPEFREIDIIENWPSEIELHIKISPPLLNLLNNHDANFSVISQDGIILQEEPSAGLPTIQIFQYEKPILIRQKLFDKEELQKILLAEKILQEELDLPLSASHLYWAAKELHLISQNDMALWIDLTQPIEPQLQKLTFSSAKIGLYSRQFEHIDLRIPKQIFWKYKF